jgi:signal transduction histidine kinase
VYAKSGALVTGPGPARSGGVVRQAVHGAAATGNMGNRIAVAVPVSDGDTVVGAILVTVGRGEVYARVARAWLAMAGLAAVAVGVTWLIARRQARRLAAPLEQLAGAASRLGDGDFSVRTMPAGITEIDTVNTSLDRTAGRLGDLVERERAFSADASHQLRTPLTGLQLGIETALATPESDLRAALTDALETSRQLETTVSDLLALARDQPRSRDPLDLERLLEELRVRWNGRLAAVDRPLRVLRDRDIPPTSVSAAAVAQILDVLLDNALRHGSGAVTVAARDAQGSLAIDVSDEGPALTADPRALFRRRSSEVSGTGIGLALARRLAEAEGGRLVLAARTPPTFTLITPAP